MIRDTAGFGLPWFAYCEHCARHHTPRWICLGYLAASEALSLLSPQNPLRRRWWYRGADHNIYVSCCRDCALRSDVAEAHSGFVSALDDAFLEYASRGGHLELDASEFGTPLTFPVLQLQEEVPSRPLAHPSVAYVYPHEHPLLGSDPDAEDDAEVTEDELYPAQPGQLVPVPAVQPDQPAREDDALSQASSVPTVVVATAKAIGQQLIEVPDCPPRSAESLSSRSSDTEDAPRPPASSWE